MAKRSSARRSTAMVLRPAAGAGGGARSIVINTPRPAAPRAAPKKHTKRHHASGASGDMTSTLLVPGAAGLILGMIDKGTFGANIPTIPGLGRAGTLALGAWFFRKHSPKYLPKLAGGFAAIALYEWQREGSVSGPADGVAAAC